MFQRISIKRVFSSGVFLDDIDTSDPDTVAHYFGVNKRFGRRNSNKG